jgi:hypothetical protein
MSDLSLSPISGVSNEKITIRTDKEKVIAEVCTDKSCKETTLLKYRGAEKDKLARESAAKLHAVISSRDLFEGALELNNDKDKIIIDNSWIPFNTTTLVDMSSENLSQAERQLKIVFFINKLWSSGIMPAQTEKAKQQMEKLRDEIGWRFRDPMLQGLHALAGNYFQLRNYQKAEETVRQIIDFKYTVTSARPVFYDEAVFLLADIKRLQAMRFWSKDQLKQTATILVESQDKLKSLEYGYKTRYNYELLKTCQIYEEQFRKISIDPTLNALCKPESVASYLKNATFVYNRYSPAFSDNFLAIKSFLAFANYNLVSNNPEDLKKAAAGYHKVLKFVRFLDNPSSVLEGNIDENWNLFYNLMHKNDRFIGKWFGKKNGLRSYAWRSKIAKTFRKVGSSQFDRKLFYLFETQAYRGLGQIERKLAKSSKDPAGLQKAIKYFEKAYQIATYIKWGRIIEFYTSKLFEERYTYNETAIDYAETLLNIYYQIKKSSPQQAQAYLTRAKSLVEDAYHHKADDPIDSTYLKALLLLGNIYEQYAYSLAGTNMFKKAYKRYRTIIRNIKKEENKLSEDKNLAPYYRYLKGMALIRNAKVLVAWPTIKGPALIKEKIKDIDDGQKELSISTISEEDKERTETEALLTKADLYLALADRSKKDKEAATASAQKLYASIPAANPFYNQAKAKQLEITIRKSEFVEKDIKGRKVTTKATKLIAEYEKLLAKLPANSYEKHQVGAALSTLYVYRNKKGDPKRVIELCDKIITYANNLNKASKVYMQTNAKLHKGIAFIQKGKDENSVALLKNARVVFDQIAKDIPNLREPSKVLAWDLHSLKANLYHRMAINYSILESLTGKDKISKRAGASYTYVYTQKCYRECLLSSSEYDQNERPLILAKDINLKNAYGKHPYPTHPQYAKFMGLGHVSYSADNKATQSWNRWKSRFITNQGLVRDYDPYSRQNRSWIFSERSGYGMYLATAFNDTRMAEKLFAGIEKYGRNKNGLYAWKLSLSGKQASTRSAADADLYIAHSAIKINSARAQELIDKIWEKEIIERGGKLIFKPSDHTWPEWGDGRVVFNPSYFAPHLIKEIAAFDKNKKHNWQKVIDDGYELLNKILINSRKLGARGKNPIPDWVLCSVIEGKLTLQRYRLRQTASEMDAIRVLLEIGRDAIINKDQRAVAFLKGLIRKARVTNVRSARLQGYNNELAIALYAVALKGAGDPYNNVASFMQKLDSSFRGTHFGFRANGKDADQYYKQSLVLMARMLLRSKVEWKDQ